MLCFTWVVSSLLSCCYLSSRLLTLPRAYLLCLTWVVSSVVIYREEYLTKPYYKPRFSQWVASSRFVEFLNYFNGYNRGFCFELFFFIFFYKEFNPWDVQYSSIQGIRVFICCSGFLALNLANLHCYLSWIAFYTGKGVNAELTSVFTPAL